MNIMSTLKTCAVHELLWCEFINSKFTFEHNVCCMHEIKRGTDLCGSTFLRKSLSAGHHILINIFATLFGWSRLHRLQSLFGLFVRRSGLRKSRQTCEHEKAERITLTSPWNVFSGDNFFPFSHWRLTFVGVNTFCMAVVKENGLLNRNCFK